MNRMTSHSGHSIFGSSGWLRFTEFRTSGAGREAQDKWMSMNRTWLESMVGILASPACEGIGRQVCRGGCALCRGEGLVSRMVLDVDIEV